MQTWNSVIAMGYRANTRLMARKPLIMLGLLSAAFLLCGCPVTQSQDTPVDSIQFYEENTGARYQLYVPSHYDAQRDWPLVITLHGTYGFDSDTAQINEWKALAEEKGFIVAAPALKSVQGILPTVDSLHQSDLQADEQIILGVLDAVCGKYHVDRQSVLLTGFSAGGYPMYYTGLRNPTKFSALAARSANYEAEIVENIPMNDDIRRMPIIIYWGKNDLQPIHDGSWAAFRYFRTHQCKKAIQFEFVGGHLRRPDLAYSRWIKYLPDKHKQK